MKNPEQQAKSLESEQVSQKGMRRTFDMYVDALRLTPEDFKESILDVGSGPGYFASEAKRRGISNNIISADILLPFRLKKIFGKPEEGFAAGKYITVEGAASLPFRDRQFELVIAAWVMDILGGEGTRAEFYESELRGAIAEMTRVADKEVRFTVSRKQPNGLMYEPFPIIQKVLEELDPDEWNVELRSFQSALRKEKNGEAQIHHLVSIKRRDKENQ